MNFPAHYKHDDKVRSVYARIENVLFDFDEGDTEGLLAFQEALMKMNDVVMAQIRLNYEDRKVEVNEVKRGEKSGCEKCGGWVESMGGQWLANGDWVEDYKCVECGNQWQE